MRVKPANCSAVAGTIADDDVRLSLAAIVASSAFHASPQLAAFLRFVVEATLSGRSEQIKGYTIAVEALGRDSAFDPQTDPIVRVEAGRLRRALDRYYAGPGQADTVVIELPRGSYVPAFRQRVPAQSVSRLWTATTAILAAVQRRSGLGLAVASGIAAYAAFDLLILDQVLYQREPKTTSVANADPVTTARIPVQRLFVGPSVFIAPVSVTGDARQSNFADVFENRLRDIFARFDDITVLSKSEQQPRADYRLTTGIDYHGDDTPAMRFHLIDESDGSIVWTRVIENAEVGTGPRGPRFPIAREIATTLLQPFGVIPARERVKLATKRQTDPRYACLLEAYDYFRTYDHPQHARVRDCLETTTRQDPTFAGGFSSLARLYFREFLAGLSRDTDSPPLDRALEAAQRAIELKPTEVRAHYVLVDIHMARGEVAEAMAAGERVLALNPYDTSAVFHYAAQLVLLGEIDRGLKLINDGVRYPGQAAPRNLFIRSIAAYLRGDFTTSAAYANQITSDRFPLGFVMRAIAQLNLGERERAKRSVARLAALYPTWQSDIRVELKKYFPLPWVVERIEKDLRDAGLSTVVADTAPAAILTPMPTLLVEPVEFVGPRPDDASDANWVRAQVLRAFKRFEDVDIIADQTPARFGTTTTTTTDYRFSTTATYERGGGLTLTFRLTEAATGMALWVKAQDGVRDGDDEAALPFLGEMAAALLHPIGVIATRERLRESSRVGQERYRCMLEAVDYLRSFAAARHAKARACLEEAVAADPAFASGFSTLARVYLREHQFGVNARPGDGAPLDRALAAAQRAVDLAPNSARAHFVMFDIRAAMGDAFGVRRFGERAVALNPYDTSVVFHYGSQLVMMGEIDAGVAMIQRITANTTVPPARLDFALFVASYLKGDMAEASRYAKRITNTAFVPGYVARVLAAYRTDDVEAVRKAIGHLVALDPNWRDDPRGELIKFIPAPTVVELFARDLAAAGLKPMTQKATQSQTHRALIQ